MQLDLFTHGRDVMLQNDVVAALRQRDADRARQAFAVLAAEFPEQEILKPLETLLNTLTTSATRAADRDDIAGRIQTMESLVAPAAMRVFGNTETGAWLSPLWQSLANASASLSFTREAPTTHAAFLLLQSGDWAGAEAAAASIPSWRRIPAPLAWMAEARFYVGGLDHSWCLLMELAWIDASVFNRLARRLKSQPLHKLLNNFELAFEGEGEADWGWFPAWLLITAPAMAGIMRETQSCNGNAQERVARLIMDLLALEKQGRHTDVVALRKKLRDFHAGLYAAYMSSR